MTILIINPVCGHYCYDDGDKIYREALWYIEPYLEQVKNELEKSGKKVIYLHLQECIRRNVWKIHESKKPIIVIGTGHGNSFVYTGYRLNPIYWETMFRDGWNYQWSREVTFLLLSCLTGKSLGKEMVNPYTYNAKYYFGWEKEFVFIVNIGKRKGKDWKETPELLFFKPIEEAWIKVGKGELNPEDAYRYIISKWREILENKEIPNHIKKWIEHDLNAMKILYNTKIFIKIIALIPMENGEYDQINIIEREEFWYPKLTKYSYNTVIEKKEKYVDGHGKIIVKVIDLTTSNECEYGIDVMFVSKEQPPQKPPIPPPPKHSRNVKITILQPKESQVIKYGEPIKIILDIEIESKQS